VLYLHSCAGLARVSKVDENRVRRMAERQLLRLRKNRRRDPHAYDFGIYELTEQDGRVLVKATDLGIIERHLTGTLAPAAEE
jgi:hypothetical protein